MSDDSDLLGDNIADLLRDNRLEEALTLLAHHPHLEKNIARRVLEVTGLSVPMCCCDWIAPVLLRFNHLVRGTELFDGSTRSYRIVRRLGAGSFAEVFESHVYSRHSSSMSPSRVAVKRYRVNGGSRWFDDKCRKESLAAEIDVSSKLSSIDRIVPVIDYGESDTGPFICMDLFEGDLDRLVRSQSPEFRIRMLRELLVLARSLHKCHVRGIIHRDINPCNILHDSQNHLYLSDFGLATESPDTEDALPLRKWGASGAADLGHPNFRAPEQTDRLGNATVASDVYSFGCVLYFLLTGQDPQFHYAGPAMGSDAKPQDPLILQRRRPDHRQNAMAYPPGLQRQTVRDARAIESIIHKCTRFHVSDRFSSMSDVAVYLEAWLEEKPRPISPPNVGFRIRRSALNYALRWATACILVFIFCGLLVHVHRVQHEQNRTQIALAERDLTVHQLVVSQARSLRQNGQTNAARQLMAKIPPYRRGFDDAVVFSNAGESFRRVLALHDGPVTAILVDHQSGQLVSAGFDGQLIVSQISDGAEIRVLVPGVWSKEKRRFKLALDDPIETYCGLRWLVAGTQFVGVQPCGTIDVWDLSNGQRVDRTMTGLPITAFDACPEANVWAIGCDDGRVVRWHPKDGLQSELRLSGSVTDIESFPDGKWAAATTTGEVFLLDDSQTRVLSCVKADINPVWDICVNGDGSVLAAATNLAAPVLVRVQDGLFGNRIELPPIENAFSELNPAIHVVQFASENWLLWAGASNGSLAAWDIVDRRRLPAMSCTIPTNSMLRNRIDEFPYRLRRAVSAIEPGSDPSRVLVAGRNGGVQEILWPEGPRIIDLSPGSQIAVSPKEPDLFVEGTDQGAVNVWQFHSGECAATQKAWHDREICSIDISDNGTILTASADGAVHLSAFDGDRLVTRSQPFLHASSIHSAAFSPDGQRFAIMDTTGKVSIFSVAGFRLLGTFEDPISLGAPRRDLEFDRTGNDLLVLGAPPSAVVLSGHNAVLRYRPEWVTASDEGAVVVRDPDIDGSFLTADLRGRISRVPVSPLSEFLFGQGDPAAGLAVIGTGADSNPLRRRYVACSRAGEVRFYVPDGDFVSISLWSPLATRNNRTTGMVVSRDDRTLAVTHEDGRLVVWQPDFSRLDDEATSSIPPLTEILASHAISQTVEINSRCAVELEDGRIALLLLGRTQSPTTRELILATWIPEQHEWQERRIHTVPVSGSDPGTIESTALTRIGNHLYGCVREQTLGYDARCFLFHVPVAQLSDLESATVSEQVFGDEDNAYLYQSLVECDKQPAIVHFDYDKMRLLLTKPTESGWATRQLGRHGDGLHCQAVSVNGCVTAIGHLNRTNGDIGLDYIITQSADPEAADQRLVIEARTSGTPVLFVDASNHPAVAYVRPCTQGAEIVVATLEPGSSVLRCEAIGVIADPAARVVDASVSMNGRTSILVGCFMNESVDLTLFATSRGRWTRTSVGRLPIAADAPFGATLINRPSGTQALINIRNAGDNRSIIQAMLCTPGSKSGSHD